MLRAALLVLLLGLGLGEARAVQPGEMLADPVLEARARHISAEIRCVVCQNQSIDDSDAPLAGDLRILVRERLKAGDDDTAVRAFIVERYGAFVLLRPPMNAQTWLLWFGPFLLLAGAGLTLALKRRARPAAAPAPLSSDEEARIAALLGEGEKPGRSVA